MDKDELAGGIEIIVRLTLYFAYQHWLEHGKPIKLEDAPLVAKDVAAAMEQAEALIPKGF